MSSRPRKTVRSTTVGVDGTKKTKRKDNSSYATDGSVLATMFPLSSNSSVSWERAKAEMVCVIPTVAFGALLHYIVDWMDGHASWKWLGSTDESVWEHMKLLYWPVLVATVGLTMWFKAPERIWWSRALGLTAGLCFLPLLFYLYTWGDIEASILWVDIMLFILAACVVGVVSWATATWTAPTLSGLLLFLVWGAAFITFSYIKPTDTFVWQEPSPT
jgi:hypothetical protein